MGKSKKQINNNGDFTDILNDEDSLFIRNMLLDVRKKCEKETDKSGNLPGIDNIYSYILKRESERKERFKKVLLPVRIIQGVAFTVIAALGAREFWMHREGLLNHLNEMTGIKKLANAVAFPVTSQTSYILLLLAVLLALSLLSLLYSALKSDKVK